MLTLPICIMMLLPQLVAGLNRKGPAAHLTLLLLGICAVTTLMAALGLRSAPPAPAGGSYDTLHLPPLVWPVLGLCLLVPFYWMVEHICAAFDLGLDTVLVQGLALTLTVALWGKAHDMTPLALEPGAILLVLTLFARGIWQLTQARMAK